MICMFRLSISTISCPEFWFILVHSNEANACFQISSSICNVFIIKHETAYFCFVILNVLMCEARVYSSVGVITRKDCLKCKRRSVKTGLCSPAPNFAKSLKLWPFNSSFTIWFRLIQSEKN